MSTAVNLRSAVCLLGRFPALAGVDLVVATGEIVLVEGANGAGKTTLLRAIAGLVPVVEGTAEVLGQDLRRDPRSLRPQVGLLGQGPGLYDDLSVAENLRFWARAAGRGSGDVARALARLGLDGRLAEQPAGRLSTGQRRRAALAAVVVRNPRLWLLDEPHAGLDAGGRDVVDDLVVEAVAGGATVVLASHERERASSLADRSVVLAGGRTLAGGSTAGAGVVGEPAHVA
ncbi:MAG: heme ABC exporter ATP-binding protein CcmA [Actinobacteria bacterium]|nr:heme ABC exporter ATP-binding protein CcmA [Actinomycetota bacterium]MBW3642069.1 heme ABC exporter ATP-binding protein CcmA [Actinomycetota bacterium]